jgi:hypothetical protein
MGKPFDVRAQWRKGKREAEVGDVGTFLSPSLACSIWFNCSSFLSPQTAMPIGRTELESAQVFEFFVWIAGGKRAVLLLVSFLG